MGRPANIWDYKEPRATAECFKCRVILCDPGINSLKLNVHRKRRLCVCELTLIISERNQRFVRLGSKVSKESTKKIL